MIEFDKLVKSGVQFGHQTWRWNPKMDPYIWGEKNGIHLIDVSKTAYQLERAAQFLESLSAEGKTVLWCGTKKAAQQAMARVAKETRSPLVSHRWIGGTLTNYLQVKKSVTKLLHLEDVVTRSGKMHYTKKELSVFQKQIERLKKNIGGLRKLIWPVGAIVVVDVKKEHVALSEARETGVPIIALVDTNCDPSGITYVIPANDDAPRSIECVLGYLTEAVARGQKTAATKGQKAPQVEVAPVDISPSVEQVLELALGDAEAAEGAKEEKAKPRIAVRKLSKKIDVKR